MKSTRQCDERMHGMMKLAETELHGLMFVDDVCGVVIHFIEVRNADENRRALRPGARWLDDRDGKMNGVATL